MYKEKYGIPEYIRCYDYNWNVFYNYILRWNYANGSIILYCFHDSYLSDNEDVLSIEYISKEAIDISEKERVSAEQERKRQAIIKEQKEKENLKNIEKEHLDKENQEKLKIQKTQQQIKEQI